MVLTFPDDDEMRAIAARTIWFEPPATALDDPIRFVAYACAYADHADMCAIRSHMSDEEFRMALDRAPPGVIDARSWHYWNLVLDRYPPPPMPERRLERT